MRFKKTFPLLALLVLSLTTACQNSILFTTSNLTGLELNTAEGGQQTAKLGYQRFEGVVMPMRTRTLPDGTTAYEEAYSVLAATSMQSTGFLTGSLGNVRITQVFATGRAAVQQNTGKVLQKAVEALGGKIHAADSLQPAESVIEVIEKNVDNEANSKLIFDAVNAELGTSVATAGQAERAVREALDSGKSDRVKAIRKRLTDAGL